MAKHQSTTRNQEALAAALSRFSTTEPYAKALLELIRADGSDVYRIQRSGSRRQWKLFVYPSEAMRQQFDIQLEVLCSTAPFTKLHPRVMAEFDKELAHQLRYEPDFGILVTSDPSAEDMVRRRAGLVSILVLSAPDLAAGKYHGKTLATLLSRVLLTVDHFDVRRPLVRPSAFFGRSTDIDRIIQLVRNEQHVGVFGLRKAGKSSLLNQVRGRLVEAQRPVAYMELNEFKSRSTRFRRLLIERLAQAVRERGADVPALALDGSPDIERINEYWLDDMERILNLCDVRTPPLIIVDEIDHAAERRHGDEVPLGRSDGERYAHFLTLTELRGVAQSRSAAGKAAPVLLVAGVDSNIFESATQFGDSNSLYQMATIHFLGPMSDRELRHMVQSLGKRTGTRFDDAALATLYDEYGGHPFLCRQACSFVLRDRNNDTVPWDITSDVLHRAFTAEGLNTPLAELESSLDGFGRWYPEEAVHVAARIAGSVAPVQRRQVEHAIAYGLLRADTQLGMAGLRRLQSGGGM